MIAFELTDEQRQLKAAAHEFAVKEILPVAAKYDEEQTFPREVARKAWENGHQGA